MLTLVSLPDLDPIFKLTLILILINLEHEPPILDSHISLFGKEYDVGPEAFHSSFDDD